MQHCVIDSERVDSIRLVALARGTARFGFAPAALERLAADRRVVETHAAAGHPVYGLNTGLGGNIDYRLDESEVVAFQEQLIRGRMIGMGEPLSPEVVRTALLARCISLAIAGYGVKTPVTLEQAEKDPIFTGRSRYACSRRSSAPRSTMPCSSGGTTTMSAMDSYQEV